MQKYITLISIITLSTVHSLHAIIESQNFYENNPLASQVLYVPNRHTSYNVHLEKNNEAAPQPCVFCAEALDTDDENNFLVARFKHHNLFINLYPYQKGHLLLLPKNHVPNLADLSDEEQRELIKILSILPTILKNLFGSTGTNIGINLGKIAGASKPDHLHVHIIPRYTAEPLSFIHLAAKTLVIDYDLTDVRKILRDYFASIQNQDIFSCN